MKNLLYTFLFCFVVFCGNSQDIIKTTSSSEIKAKVLEINENTVKYKKYDYQDGPTFTLKKSEIISITYQNGTSDFFQSPIQTNQNAFSLPNTTSSQSNSQKGQNTQINQNPSFITTSSSPSNHSENSYSNKKKRKYNEMKRFFLYTGVSFPVGRFSKLDDGCFVTPFWTDVDNYGGAQIGFNFGIKGRIPVSKHIGITISGDLFLNGIKDTAFTVQSDHVSYLCEEVNHELGVDALDYRLNTRSKYLNIPIMLGLNFTYLFNRKIGLSVEGSLGVDFDFITPTVYRNNLAGTFIRSEYDSYTNIRTDYYSAEKNKFIYVPTVHFAYQGNISFIFGKRWSFGVFFFGTTKSNIKFDEKETSKSYKMDKTSGTRYYCRKLSINMLMLRVGVGF